MLKHIFNILNKFPAFSLSGKVKIQIPFSMCYGNPFHVSNAWVDSCVGSFMHGCMHN